ncbi:MAG: hypothetical protein AAB729_03510, partial [Patescibacteria group bacterium]
INYLAITPKNILVLAKLPFVKFDSAYNEKFLPSVSSNLYALIAKYENGLARSQNSLLNFGLQIIAASSASSEIGDYLQHFSAETSNAILNLGLTINSDAEFLKYLAFDFGRQTIYLAQGFWADLKAPYLAVADVIVPNIKEQKNQAKYFASSIWNNVVSNVGLLDKYASNQKPKPYGSGYLADSNVMFESELPSVKIIAERQSRVNRCFSSGGDDGICTPRAMNGNSDSALRHPHQTLLYHNQFISFLNVGNSTIRRPKQIAANFRSGVESVKYLVVDFGRQIKYLTVNFWSDVKAPYVVAARVANVSVIEQAEQFARTFNNTKNGWNGLAVFYKSGFGNLVSLQKNALAEQREQLAWAVNSSKNGWNEFIALNSASLNNGQLALANASAVVSNSLIQNIGMLDMYARNDFDQASVYAVIPGSQLSLRVQPKQSDPGKDCFVGCTPRNDNDSGEVLGITTTPNQPKVLAASTVSLDQSIQNILNQYLAQGKFKGQKGDKGDSGSNSGMVQNSNGNSTAIIGGTPIVTYIPAYQPSGFSGTSLAGFGQLSSQNFNSQTITASGSLTVQGASSLTSLTVSGSTAISSLTAGTTTLSSLTVSGPVTLNGSTTIAGLTVTG